MSEYIIVTGNESGSDLSLHSYSFSGGTLTRVDSLSTGGIAPKAVAVNDGTIYLPYKESSVIKLGQAELAEDGTLSNWSSGSQILAYDGDVASAVISPDGTRLLVSSGQQGTSGELALIDISATTPSVLDTLSVARVGSNTSAQLVDARFSANGERIMCAFRGDSLRLVSAASDILSELDSSTFSDAICVSLLDGTEWIAGESSSSSFSDITVVDVASDTITSSDTKDGSTLGAGLATGALRALSATSAVGAAGVYGWNGTAISLSSSHAWGFDIDAVEVSSDQSYAAAADVDNLDPTLHLFSSSAWGTEADSVEVPVSSQINAIAFGSVTTESGPTTSEERFQASYSAASAAPPKVTALIRPADVQRSIDTDVNNLKDGPKFYTVDAIIPLGELEHLRPGNVFSVQDNQPGLRTAKNLLLKSYRMRSADPTEPVSLTLWG